MQVSNFVVGLEGNNCGFNINGEGVNAFINVQIDIDRKETIGEIEHKARHKAAEALEAAARALREHK